MHNSIAHQQPKDAHPIPKQWQICLLANSPQFHCSARCHMAWNRLLARLGQLSWSHPLPAPCAPPTFSLAGGMRNQKPSNQCKHYSATTKNQCVIIIFLILNPPNSTMLATMKKMDSIPGKTRTKIYENSKYILHTKRISNDHIFLPIYIMLP